MAIRIYSDKTQKFYNTVEEANKAELEAKKAELEAKEAEARERARKEREAAAAKEKKEKDAAQRKALAAEVEAARKTMVEAQKAYRDKLSKFCQTYGTYHYSTTTEDIPTLFDIFDPWVKALL